MGTELEVDAISDGVDVLIPGIMQHIERAGVHSGDSGNGFLFAHNGQSLGAGDAELL